MVKVTKQNISREHDEAKEKQVQKTITQLRTLSEEEQASAFARHLELPYADLHIFPVNGEDVRILPENIARKYSVAIFHKGGHTVRVAALDPAAPDVQEFLEKLAKENGWAINVYVVSASSLGRAFDLYKSASLIDIADTLRPSLSGKDLARFEEELGDLLRLKQRINEVPMTEIITIVVAGALKMDASDIHFEPQENGIRLRYRIDGVLHDITTLPSKIYTLVLSRIKMMSGMKINVRDRAQDGHFSLMLEKDKRIDVRISIIPGNHGESIVARLLNQASILIDLEQLGLRGLAFEQIQKQTLKSDGMILTTGPTGSGKTTMLYALLRRLNSPGVKIITIEDPIEYQVESISQTQVASDHGYTFANGLRAIVRQDPDIILVGEIRDEETADIALNAALTGHLVLSTLHTNNAAASIPRLLELGVKTTLIAPAVNAFIAQRLVRRLCACKEAYTPAPETVEIVKKLLAIISPKSKIEIPKTIDKLYRSVGCAECHNLGYKGRIGIFEVLTINETIERLILDMASESEITRAALEDGMITMTQDGILKAVEGITSLDEIWRVTAQSAFLEEIYEKLMAQTLARATLLSPDHIDRARACMTSLEKMDQTIRALDQKIVFPVILASALLLKAGDIHVEPEEKDVNIRFRIDGVLQTVARIPITDYPQLLGRIKLLSGMEAERRQGVKDSRFTIELEQPLEGEEKRIDVRVSIILGGLGETVVMRLLNRSAVALDIEHLGIRKQNLEKILREIKKPNGIFLNTGPTGSGKTTTLYSILNVLNAPSVKIITVEDPIEYQLKGVLQTQANDKDGYTFATALRALLRQNPDIMMVGEIRDEETATIAVQAALTGHLIFSTLHTNDAIGSIQRLINMSVRADDLAIASNVFMAQRLVRKLCVCKKQTPLAGKDQEKIIGILKTIPASAGVTLPQEKSVFVPGSCTQCNGVGFKGRTTISEVLVVDATIKQLITRGADVFQIKEKAIDGGMLTMLHDGILKVLEGETTLEEVQRVTATE